MDQEAPPMAQMKQLGFSEYESKAYLALLETYPLSGYALSKASGVPRSRIYEVLGNLTAKQVVMEESREKTPLYYPVAPNLVVARLKQTYDGIFTQFSEYAGRRYSVDARDDRLVVVQGRKRIIELLTQLISRAEHRIALSIWSQELGELKPELDRALDRGVMLRGISFGEGNGYADLVSHRHMGRYRSEKKERFMSVVIDGIQTVSGIVSRGENSRATWTRDEGFTAVSEDYIVHDLLVNLYSAALDDGGRGRYEVFADQVHDYYFHYKEKPGNL